MTAVQIAATAIGNTAAGQAGSACDPPTIATANKIAVPTPNSPTELTTDAKGNDSLGKYTFDTRSLAEMMLVTPRATPAAKNDQITRPAHALARYVPHVPVTENDCVSTSP